MPTTLRFVAVPKAEHTVKLVPEFYRLVRNSTSDPAFWARVEASRERLKNASAFDSGPQHRLKQQVRHDRDGTPIVDRDAHIQALDAVTQDDIQAVRSDLLGWGDLLMVYMGHPDRIQAGMRAYGAPKRAVVFRPWKSIE